MKKIEYKLAFPGEVFKVQSLYRELKEEPKEEVRNLRSMTLEIEDDEDAEKVIEHLKTLDGEIEQQ